jgi:polyisoprenoid-binding protein YceI
MVVRELPNVRLPPPRCRRFWPATKIAKAIEATFAMNSCLPMVPARHGQMCQWLLAALTLAVMCSAGQHAAMSDQSWRIDEAHTLIGFKIDATGTRGRFTHYTGRILIDFDRPAKSFTSFTVYSASVDVGSQSFNDFVKSAAMLDVARFPTLRFTSTQVEKLNPRTARVKGNLTMLGVTKPITLTVNVETDPSAEGRVVAFSAKSTIKPSEFGVIFGTLLIDDTLEIIIKTRAER